MLNVYLEKSADGVWYRGTDPWPWKKKTEPCDPLGEIIALVETNLSFLVEISEKLQAEVQPLLYAPKRIDAQHFFEFREQVVNVCEMVKKENTLLGCLAEAYIEETELFYLKEDYFDKLYRSENGQPLVQGGIEHTENGFPIFLDDEENFFDAVEVLEAMRCGANLPWHLLQCQTTCETYLDHVIRHPYFKFPLSEYLEVQQAVGRTENDFIRHVDGFRTQYLFRSPMKYYRFLIIQNNDRAHPVARCSYCGKYFVPSSKNNTKYCDRIQRNGRTCRDLGPAANHKQKAQADPVIETFDRVKRRMYKRRERSLDGMCTAEKVLDAKAYFAWLDAAEDARNRYRAGTLTPAEALRIIEG